MSRPASGWRCVPLAFATFEWCMSLAKLVANSTRQRIDAESPLLSASLPGGERIQIVLPPATTAETVAITIRRPADEVWTLDELAQKGVFRSTRQASTAPDDTEIELLQPARGPRVHLIYASGGGSAQEHPGVWAHGFRQDDLYQGADSRDSA